MQLFSAIVFAAVASAQLLTPDGQLLNIDGLTDCGQQCFNQSISAAVGCKPTDMMCLCVNDPFHQGMLPCLVATCSLNELDQTFAWVHPRCDEAFCIAQAKGIAEVEAAWKQALAQAQALN